MFAGALAQVTCITGRSLGLLPPTDKKKCHKVRRVVPRTHLRRAGGAAGAQLSERRAAQVVVGLDTGIITCFRMKKGEASTEFETNNLDYAVSALIIGGPPEKRDRVRARHPAPRRRASAPARGSPGQDAASLTHAAKPCVRY
jgi:hypothetical protein